MQRLLFAALALGCFVTPARAQDCGCDHRVELDVGMFHGGDEGVTPGDVVCVMAGEREFLRLRALEGTADAPVTVINCGGRAVITNPDRAYSLVVEEGSHHFRITGTGDPEEEYGFDLSAPATDPYPGVGLWLLGRSSDYEVDHLEIHDTGFAGVSAKTDPLCDGSADQGTFTQRNTHIHHLWVHDTGGEGFYIGSTQADGQTITCDGSSEVHQPHFLEGVDVHDNLIETTGWDGAQIGMARDGCRFYRNVIRDVGLAGEEFQQQGLQIGDFSRCEIFANVIERGPAMGIIVLGADDTTIHSNVIVGFTEADGIYMNHRDRIPGARYRVAFNTIIGYDRSGVTVFGAGLGESGAWSNLVVGADPGIGAGGDVSWMEDGNVVVADRAAAGFVGDEDLHLTEGSAARGAGVPALDVMADLDGYPRADPPSAGAYEWVDPTLDAGPPPAGVDAGFDPGTDAGSSASDGGVVDGGDDGCGCTAAGRRAPPSLAWLALLACLATRRGANR